MHSQLSNNCKEHGVKCPDKAIRYSNYYKAFQLVAPNAFYSCHFCPSCGVKLPKEDENRPIITEWLKQNLDNEVV